MLDQLGRLFSGFTIRQRITLGLAAAAVAAGLWGFVRWSHERGFEPLYLGLAPDDASSVVERLRASGIEYRLSEGGATVKVSQSQAAEARLLVAGAGLPKTGRLGFELFDTTNFGLTEFAEQVNYRRAIEGELERSIMTIQEIERARVHISLAKDSVFLEAREEAKASVLVKLRPRADLSAQNGAAICHLVAAAVNRLSPRNVTVVDTEGRLLVKPQPGSIEGGAADGLIEYRQQLERDLLQKIHRTVEPLVGEENYRAGVSIECDLETRETSEETFDPGKAVVQNTQKTEDVAGSPQTAGAPGTASNLPRPPVRSFSSTQGVSRKTENTTYQTSRTVVHTKAPQGAIRRISVAVLLGHATRWQGTGAQAKRIVEAPDPKRIETIRSLVAAAAGISKERGDILTVEALPFEPRAEPMGGAVPPPAPRADWLDSLMRLPLFVKIGAGVAVALMLIVPVVLLTLRSKRPVLAATPAALPGATANGETKSIEQTVAEREAERKRRDAEALSQLALPPIETPRAELLAKLIRDNAKADPGSTARLLEGWMNERD